MTALWGVSSLGLMTMVLPVTSAGAALARDQEEREVPGQDAADDADGLAEEEDRFAGTVAFQNLAFDAARPFGHVVEVVGGESHFHAGQRQRLALLLGDDPGKRLDLFADFRGDSTQESGALDSRAAAPIFLRGFGGPDRLLDVPAIRIGYGANRRTGGWVAHFDHAE